MDVLAKQPAAPWVRELYLDKFERRWFSSRMYWDEDESARILALLDALPEGPALKERHADFLAWLASATQPATTQPGVPR